MRGSKKNKRGMLKVVLILTIVILRLFRYWQVPLMGSWFYLRKLDLVVHHNGSPEVLSWPSKHTQGHIGCY